MPTYFSYSPRNECCIVIEHAPSGITQINYLGEELTLVHERGLFNYPRRANDIIINWLRENTMPRTQRQQQNRVEQLQRTQRAEADQRRASTARAYTTEARTSAAIQNNRSLSATEVFPVNTTEEHYPVQEALANANVHIGTTIRYAGNPINDLYTWVAGRAVAREVATPVMPEDNTAIVTPVSDQEELSAYTQRYCEVMQEWVLNQDSAEAPSLNVRLSSLGEATRGLAEEIYSGTINMRHHYERLLEMMIEQPVVQGIPVAEATSWLASSPF